MFLNSFVVSNRVCGRKIVLQDTEKGKWISGAIRFVVWIGKDKYYNKRLLMSSAFRRLMFLRYLIQKTWVNKLSEIFFQEVSLLLNVTALFFSLLNELKDFYDKVPFVLKGF